MHFPNNRDNAVMVVNPAGTRGLIYREDYNIIRCYCYFWLLFNKFSERSPSRGGRVGWACPIAKISPLAGAGQVAAAHCPMETHKG